MLDQYAIKLDPFFSILLATGQELLMKSCILAWMEQEAIMGDNNFKQMLKVVCVHTLCWADGPMLGVVSGVQLPHYQAMVATSLLQKLSSEG